MSGLVAAAADADSKCPCQSSTLNWHWHVRPLCSKAARSHVVAPEDQISTFSAGTEDNTPCK